MTPVHSPQPPHTKQTQVEAEVAKMEADLKARHEQELARFASKPGGGGGGGDSAGMFCVHVYTDMYTCVEGARSGWSLGVGRCG